MEEQEHDLFITDLVNVGTVLPNVTTKDLYRALRILGGNKDRVQIVLKQYLFSDNQNDSNVSSVPDDIEHIRTVIPDCSMDRISKAIQQVEGEKNRVQLVLKKYFEEENMQLKRTLEVVVDYAIPEKKQKLDSAPTETAVNNHLSSDTEENVCDNVEDLHNNINTNNNIIDFTTNNFNIENDTITVTNHLQNEEAIDIAIAKTFSRTIPENNQTLQTPSNQTTLTEDCVTLLEDNASNFNITYTKPNSELYEDDSSSDNFDVFDLHDSQMIYADKYLKMESNVENVKVIPDVEIISDTMFDRPSSSYLNLPSTSILNRPLTPYVNYPSTSSSHQYHIIPPSSNIVDYQSKASTSSLYTYKVDLPTTTTTTCSSLYNNENYAHVVPKALETKQNSTCNLDKLLSHTNNLKRQMAQIDKGLQSICTENATQREPLPIGIKRNVPATIVKNPTTYSRNNPTTTIVSKGLKPIIGKNNVEEKPVMKYLRRPHIEGNGPPIPIIDLSETPPKMTRTVEEIFEINLARMNRIMMTDRNAPKNVAMTGAIPKTVRYNLPAANITPTMINPTPYINRMAPTPHETYDWSNPITVRNDLTTANNTLPATIVKQERKEIARNNIIVPTSTNVAVSNDLVLVSVNSGVSSSKKPSESENRPTTTRPDHPYFFKLMEMFPDISPNYLRNLCDEKEESAEMFEYLISVLLNGKYPLRVRTISPVTEVDFDEQYKLLLDLFPDADPTYLQHQCERLIDKPEHFKNFVATNLETKSYPSKKEYLRKLKLSVQEKQYTTEFDVKKFLEIIPNPNEYFAKLPEKTTLNANFNDCNYALTFLKNHYSNLQIQKISQVFKKQNFSVVKTAEILDKSTFTMKSKRKLYPVTSCTNIPLLQEIAYVAHKQDINKYIELQKCEKKENRKHAKAAGLFKTCGCCFDEEIMPDEIVCCEGGHEFCMECVKKGSEVLIGEQKLQFPCLQDCDQQFNLHVLQMVLAPKVFSKLIQRKMLEEVKAAGIEELESCPFCDFATIPAPGDKLFRCLNDDCMKESCRLCKELSHIPLRCEEVEREKDVIMRTYIEDKMTEALIRKCYKCGMKFVKEDGCNKMTCSCGAMMCYVCQQPVSDYKHFNGQGGDNFHLCPLYSDTNKLHIESVKLGAETAKKELGLNADDKKLINDPTENLERHFKKTTGFPRLL